jgi:hypothetical protein
MLEIVQTGSLLLLVSALHINHVSCQGIGHAVGDGVGDAARDATRNAISTIQFDTLSFAAVFGLTITVTVFTLY